MEIPLSAITGRLTESPSGDLTETEKIIRLYEYAECASPNKVSP